MVICYSYTYTCCCDISEEVDDVDGEEEDDEDALEDEGSYNLCQKFLEHQLIYA